MSRYIDADLLRKEIERRKIAYRSSDNLQDAIRYDEITDLLAFIDTLPEQEHPIYQLNQILLDWVREAKTDKEQEARFEAYKRFFELYDEYMMQEPEQPASEGLEEELDETWLEYCEDVDYLVYASIARHFAEWGATHLKK